MLTIGLLADMGLRRNLRTTRPSCKYAIGLTSVRNVPFTANAWKPAKDIPADRMSNAQISAHSQSLRRRCCGCRAGFYTGRQEPLHAWQLKLCGPNSLQKILLGSSSHKHSVQCDRVWVRLDRCTWRNKENWGVHLSLKGETILSSYV